MTGAMAVREGISGTRDRGADCVTLGVLRILEARPSLTGLEVARHLDTLRPVLGMRGQPAVYPLLYSLLDEGLIRRTDERPPRYSVTERGRRVADALAPAVWPSVRDGFGPSLRTLFAGDARFWAVGTLRREPERSPPGN